MAVIRKHYGEAGLNAFLSIIIVDVTDFFNVGKLMGENQIIATIRLIVEDFYYLNIEDFKLCFNNAKRGKYGKIYDRIDGNVIYDWLTQYSEERTMTAYPEGFGTPKIADKNDRTSVQNANKEHDFRLRELIEKFKQ